MAALKYCTSLEVLAIVCTDDAGLDNYAPDGAELGSDPRFVMLVVRDILVGWESGARTRGDYWERADEFVAKRRSGEIKGGPSRHLLDTARPYRAAFFLGFTLKSTEY